MQFLTINKPTRGSYQAGASLAELDMGFEDFEYEVTGAPEVERVRAVVSSTRQSASSPIDLQLHVERGAQIGWQRAHEQGVRFCCVGFSLQSISYNGIPATQFAVRMRIANCLCFYALQDAQPVPPLQKEWLTPDVVGLARGIDAGAALDGIPALSDALQEAGCDDPLVMEHLRTCPDHSPSCWVVEMILESAGERPHSG